MNKNKSRRKVGADLSNFAAVPAASATATFGRTWRAHGCCS